MSYLVGLKLWSTNQCWFAEAASLYKSKKIDFIELYIAPTTTLQDDFSALAGVPITIHAPHENHDFNTSALSDTSVHRFHDVVQPIADAVQASHIVVHAGVGTTEAGFTDGITQIADARIIIENMPKLSLQHETCFGHSLSEIQYIHTQRGFPICLDLGHAIKSACSQRISYEVFLDQIVATAQPFYFHLSDGDSNSPIDDHLSLGTGNYNLAYLKSLILQQAQKQETRVVFEVPKNNRDLQQDVENIHFFKNYPIA